MLFIFLYLFLTLLILSALYRKKVICKAACSNLIHSSASCGRVLVALHLFDPISITSIFVIDRSNVIACVTNDFRGTLNRVQHSVMIDKSFVLPSKRYAACIANFVVGNVVLVVSRVPPRNAIQSNRWRGVDIESWFTALLGRRNTRSREIRVWLRSWLSLKWWRWRAPFLLISGSMRQERKLCVKMPPSLSATVSWWQLSTIRRSCLLNSPYSVPLCSSILIPYCRTRRCGEKSMCISARFLQRSFVCHICRVLLHLEYRRVSSAFDVIVSLHGLRHI